MVDWPNDLVRDIARRRCVLVVGSGVSGQAVGDGGVRPPTWRRFLQNANEDAPNGPHDHVAAALADGDLLHACEWLKKQFDHGWTQYLRDAFTRPRFQPSEVHTSLAKLDARIVFSLNFEDILDRAFTEVYGGTNVVKRYHDDGVAEFLRGTERYLVKVHGTLAEPNKLIFTQREYAEARISAAPFYNAFDSALMTHTFLFVGAGYSDPDVNLILENQNFMFSEIHPHYFLSNTGLHHDLKESLRKNRNLKVIEYDKVDDNYSGFPHAIGQLLELVEAQREQIASTQEW